MSYVLEETFGGNVRIPPWHYADRTSYDCCDMQWNNFVFARLLQLKKYRSRGRLEKNSRVCVIDGIVGCVVVVTATYVVRYGWRDEIKVRWF